MPDSTLAVPSSSLVPSTSTSGHSSPLRPEDSVSQLEKQRSVVSNDDDEIDDLLRNHRSRGVCANVGVALCNLIPPLGVAISRGHTSDVALALFLTLLFYVPGLIYAFHCQFSPRTSSRTQVPCLCGL